MTENETDEALHNLAASCDNGGNPEDRAGPQADGPTEAQRAALKEELRAEIESEARANLKGSDLEREIRRNSRTPNADLIAVREGKEPLGMRPLDESDQADPTVEALEAKIQAIKDNKADDAGRLGPDAVARGNVGVEGKIEKLAGERADRLEAALRSGAKASLEQ